MPRTAVEKKPAPLKLKIEYPSEAWEQMEVITWCEKNEYRFPALKMIYHSPNGEERPARTRVRKSDGKVIRFSPVGLKLKRMGTKKGWLDLQVPVPRGGYHGLFIEMKSTDPAATTTPEQDEWIELLRDLGHAVAVCRGAESAKKILTWYMSLPVNEACACLADPLQREEFRHAA